MKCGYNKCDGSLEFHHVDVNEKEKLYVVSCKSRQNLKDLIEDGKVILLCSNCHREEHYNNPNMFN